MACGCFFSVQRMLLKLSNIAKNASRLNFRLSVIIRTSRGLPELFIQRKGLQELKRKIEATINRMCLLNWKMDIDKQFY